MQTYLKTKRPFIQLLLFIGIALGSFIVLSLIGTFILSQMTGIKITDVERIGTPALSGPKALFFMRGLLLVQFLGFFFIPSLLFGYFSDPRPLKYIGMKKPYSPVFWALGILTFIVAFPLVEFIGNLNQQINLGGSAQRWMKDAEENAARQIQFMLSTHTVKDLVTNLVFIALFAGVGEELLFRGVLQRIFIRMFRNPWMGIVLAATIFSAIHFQFFGFFPRLLLGVILGAIYWYSGSIWPSMLAHFLYDGAVLVAAYLNPELVSDPSRTIIDPKNMIVPGIISLALTVLMIWQMKKRSRANFQDIYREEYYSEDENKFSF